MWMEAAAEAVVSSKRLLLDSSTPVLTVMWFEGHLGGTLPLSQIVR